MTGGTADLFVNGGAGGCAFMSEVRWTALAWWLFLVRAEQSSSAVLAGGLDGHCVFTLAVGCAVAVVSGAAGVSCAGAPQHGHSDRCRVH